MEHKLFKIHIYTYYFGNCHYDLYVLADSKVEALEYVYGTPRYRNDEDAIIEEVVEIAPETKGIV